MREQNIEKLFKDTFSNFEADVNPSVWSNIEQGLPASPQHIPGSSPVAKPSGFFGKISLNTIVLVAAISATIIGTTLYFSSQKPTSQNILAQQVQAQPQVMKDNSIAVSKAAPVTSLSNAPVGGSKNVAEKQTAAKAKEKVYLNQPPRQAPSEAKTENVSNANSVQVSVEKPSSPEPVNVVAPQHTSSSLQKMAIENNQQQASKTSALPSVENPVATAAPSNKVPATHEATPGSEEQFHFFVPNVFTPNGDGLNDNLKPVSNYNVKEYELTIFDRYGFEIFKSKDIDFSWDGKLKNGEEATEAVYVYIIKLVDFNDEEHNYMGYVALLK